MVKAKKAKKKKKAGKKESRDAGTKLEVEIPKEGETFPATVTGLVVCTAKEIFKDAAKNPDSLVLKIEYDVEGGDQGHVVCSLPRGYREGQSIRVRNPKAKLYQYVRAFGAPEVGQKIAVAIDAKGYWVIST